MIGKAELRRIFPEPFVTKKDVKERMGYQQYNEIRQYFYGLESFGTKYLTEDVIGKMLEVKNYGD